ncbi:MAG: hypothetical protein LCH54_02945 [Bacteroidetes bacterium]|nr:hypothetical protein [Bacteroidota bacterium]
MKSIYGFSVDKFIAEKYIQENILKRKTKTIIVFDFREIVFDHYFVEAFGLIQNNFVNDETVIDAIFQIHSFQLNELLGGFIDSNKIKYSKMKDGDIQEHFIKNNLTLKVMYNQCDIEYISNLNEKHKIVLDYINKNGEASFNDLYENKILTLPEELSPILSELQRLRFIYKGQNAEYISIKKLISKVIL